MHEVYDAAGRLVAVWRPKVTNDTTGSTKGRAKFAYAYDANGNRLSQTDPLGRASEKGRQKRGRECSVRTLLRHSYRAMLCVRTLSIISRSRRWGVDARNALP
jgi:YD repeat-containing protein